MKKILVILMAMLLVVSLAACGNKAPDGYEDWTYPTGPTPPHPPTIKNAVRRSSD